MKRSHKKDLIHVGQIMLLIDFISHTKALFIDEDYIVQDIL